MLLSVLTTLVGGLGLLGSPAVRAATTGADDWVLVNTNLTANHYQAQPYVSNGYIGHRLPVEGTGFAYDTVGANGEDENGWPLFNKRYTGAYVAGFWDLQPRTPGVNFPELLAKGGESVISTVPAWSALYVTAASGETYSTSVNHSHLQHWQQSMSLSDGYVKTSVVWHYGADADATGDANTLKLEYTVLAHREIPTLGVVRLDITSPTDTTVRVDDVLDGATSMRTVFVDKGFPESDERGIWTAVRPYGLADVHAYEYSHLEFSDASRVGPRKQSVQGSSRAATIGQAFSIDLKAGETFTVYKYVGIATTDAYASNTLKVASYSAKIGAALGWQLLFTDHKMAWWKSWASADIVVADDRELQLTARASLFHLLAALRPGSEPTGRGDTSIAVGGLSSDSYAGMVFWDADTWMYPSLAALHPDYASNINNFRWRIHNQSLANAAENGLDGAIYSWTSGRFGNCTSTGPCADYQYHLNADIALAHWQEYLLSNDTQFLQDQAWPVIRDAADMFASYVVKNASTNGTYWTLNMTDPDEYANFVDNGGFTNGAIVQLMGWARRAAELVGAAVPDKWIDIEHNMYLPVAPSDIVLEFSKMNGSAEIKQADIVLLNYPYEYNLTTAQSVKSLEFYAQAQSNDGPAMTWAIFAINALEFAPHTNSCDAYTYIKSASEPYVRKPYYQFSEQVDDDPSTNGGTHPAFPFLTGHGGFLQTFTHGIVGFRPREDHIELSPRLPVQMSGVTVKGLKWRGHVVDVAIGTEETTVTLVTHRPLQDPARGGSADEVLQDLAAAAPTSWRRRGLELAKRFAGALTKRGEHGNKTEVPVVISYGDWEKMFYITADKPLTFATEPAPAYAHPGLDRQGAQYWKCTPATSNTTYVQTRYPFAAVDGSNATAWQPASRNLPAALVVPASAADLPSDTVVRGVEINFGKQPPKAVSIGYAPAGTDADDDLESVVTWLAKHQSVAISAPYNYTLAMEVSLKVGNTTTVMFDESDEAAVGERAAGLTMDELQQLVVVVEGSWDTEKRYGDVGCMVHEVDLLV
ncbi:glycosyl hydrolase family 65 central catalytic domain-containing protein [Dipodascopsis tothii]|uniref:glycosyl hydrolase family 65 central catalytic domain-containing protein n=1 Tax=Dipodascopsis tothii TaxID=44089 RepID=UPI0034CF9D94